MPVRLGRPRRTPGRPVAGLKPTGDMPHRTMLIHPLSTVEEASPILPGLSGNLPHFVGWPIWKNT